MKSAMTQGARVITPVLVCWLLLARPLRDELESRHTKATIVALEAGLAAHYLDHGAYPQDGPLPAVELVELLVEGGHLDRAPRNPYTGAPYGADPFEVDRLWYSLEAGGATYVLEALSADGGTVLQAARAAGSAR